jgi:hypothetical protein
METMSDYDEEGQRTFDYSDRVYDKMNPEIKAKWVAALRSGEYAQTAGTLNRQTANGDSPAGYCCLGVLCDVGVSDGVIEKQDGPPEYRHASYRLIGGETYWVDTMPSSGISGWAGLDHSAESDLAEMNDGGGKSFSEIADFIEEKL